MPVPILRKSSILHTHLPAHIVVERVSLNGELLKPATGVGTWDGDKVLAAYPLPKGADSHVIHFTFDPTHTPYGVVILPPPDIGDRPRNIVMVFPDVRAREGVWDFRDISHCVLATVLEVLHVPDNATGPVILPTLTIVGLEHFGPPCHLRPHEF